MPQMAQPDSEPDSPTRHQLIVSVAVTTKKATSRTTMGTKKERAVMPIE